ncbi:endo-1,4-beta-xylanase [Alienimonas sp. DA493]|uniref:endo-1,4-beta-xylanase n=1 Tax=Alienimonas sp. DA493 TaxID=3373605 RepID=UPI003753F2ED
MTPLLLGLALSAAVPAPAAGAGDCRPVELSAAEAHRLMLDRLGIDALRPGADGWNRDAPNAANYDEAQAVPYPDLPDPLLTEAGDPVATAERWRTVRRPELLELFSREVYGRVPDDAPAVTWDVTETERRTIGDVDAVTKTLVGRVDNSACPGIEVGIELYLAVPADAAGPVPCVLEFGFGGFDPPPARTGDRRSRFGGAPPWAGQVLDAGWAFAMVVPNSIQADDGAGLTRGVIGLSNGGRLRDPDDWGALRAWAWGASRALDRLEADPDVDGGRVAIEGLSRYGKAALVAMAYDERFAAAFVGSSGKGGAALLRRDFGERVENLASAGESHWMAGNFLKYGGPLTPGDLPVDAHQLIALCAPRPVFLSYGAATGPGAEGQWVDQRGSFQAAVAAGSVYELLGGRGLGADAMPAVGVALADGDLAWRQHAGGHTTGPNWPAFLAFAGRYFATAGDDPGREPSDPPPTLKGAVGGRFKIGVAAGVETIADPANAALIVRHFEIVTPENCMKPQGIHPAENEYRFGPTDRFVAFAAENGLEVVGHCLVWAKDDRTDEWMKTEPDGSPVTRETLLRRIEEHVATVAGRYAEQCTMWDVVNEALAEGEDEGLLRDSVYSRTTGVDFLVAAFKAARAADPDALLIYNDYNGHKPGKREKLLELLRTLKERGAPVDAYGMQGHFELGDASIDQLRETFDALRELGVKVVVSELDVDVVTRGRWWADGGAYRDELRAHDPYPDGLPDEVAGQLAEEYAALFRLFLEYDDVIARVTFWNPHDGESWLNDFPWRRTNHPLLFDRDRQPKPAFHAVIGVLNDAGVPADAE